MIYADFIMIRADLYWFTLIFIQDLTLDWMDDV